MPVSRGGLWREQFGRTLPAVRLLIGSARRQTIPEFVVVLPKISLEVRNRLAVYTSRPLVGPNPLIGFPYFPFRNVIWLCSMHEGPPVAGCPQARAEQRNPFAPAPLQDLHHCRVGGGAH